MNTYNFFNMGKNDRYTVWGCDNARQYLDRYVIKPHISKWDQSLQLLFFSPKNENEVKTWIKLVNRVSMESSGKKKTFQVNKYTKICSNHFEYGRPIEAAPNPTLFLKSYDDDAKVGVKRKARTARKEPPTRKKILSKEPALDTKKLQLEKEQLQEIQSDPEYHPLSPFSSSRVEEPTCSTFADVSLLSSEIGNIEFDISETQETKLAEEPLSISTIPLHEPTATSNSSSSNEHQHQLIPCPRLSWKYVKKYPTIVKLYTGCPT